MKNEEGDIAQRVAKKDEIRSRKVILVFLLKTRSETLA